MECLYPHTNRNRPALSNARGFSLVEVLVAAVLLSLTLVALIAIIRKGREIDINDLHRRQARTLICAQFESQTYQQTNYPNLRAAAPSSVSTTVTVDPRIGNGGVALTGTLRIDVTRPALTMNGVNGVQNIAPVKVVGTVLWNEPNFADSVVLEKYLTQ
jgi:prepilin-type N-terminal cleavage/methylation domain-containing protein